MFRARTVATMVAGGLAVAACGADSSPTAPESGSVPSFRTENSPPGPGALVFRSSGGFFTTWRGDNYLVAIGLTPRDAVDFCTGNDGDLGESLTHFVERPNGGIQELFKGVGKVPLLLFPGDAEDICSASPVAEGIGHYTENLSSVGSGFDRVTSGFRIRGNVTDQAGERHHVLVVVRSQFRSDGFRFVVDKVAVN